MRPRITVFAIVAPVRSFPKADSCQYLLALDMILYMSMTYPNAKENTFQNYQSSFLKLAIASRRTNLFSKVDKTSREGNIESSPDWSWKIFVFINCTYAFRDFLILMIYHRRRELITKRPRQTTRGRMQLVGTEWKYPSGCYKECLYEMREITYHWT